MTKNLKQFTRQARIPYEPDFNEVMSYYAGRARNTYSDNTAKVNYRVRCTNCKVWLKLPYSRGQIENHHNCTEKI